MVFLLLPHRRLALSLHLPHSVNFCLSYGDISHKERQIIKAYIKDIRRKGRWEKEQERKQESRCEKEGEFWAKSQYTLEEK